MLQVAAAVAGSCFTPCRSWCQVPNFSSQHWVQKSTGIGKKRLIIFFFFCLASYKKIKTRNLKVPGTDEIELTCQGEGYPLAEVSWPNISVPANTSYTKTSEGLYQVTSVLRLKPHPGRNFSCVFWNANMKEFTLAIIVPGKNCPPFLALPSRVQARNGWRIHNESSEEGVIKGLFMKMWSAFTETAKGSAGQLRLQKWGSNYYSWRGYWNLEKGTVGKALDRSCGLQSRDAAPASTPKGRSWWMGPPTSLSSHPPVSCWWFPLAEPSWKSENKKSTDTS